jgi:hypothetical protein
MEKLRDYATKIASVDGTVELDPITILVIELVLKILVNRCSRFNAGTANQPNMLDRWWLWLYVRQAVKQVLSNSIFSFDRSDLKSRVSVVYDNLLKAGETAQDSEIRDIINCVVKG